MYVYVRHHDVAPGHTLMNQIPQCLFNRGAMFNEVSKSEVGIIKQMYTRHMQVMSHCHKLLFSSLKGLPPLGILLARPSVSDQCTSHRLHQGSWLS